jgi:hypothetical protein
VKKLSKSGNKSHPKHVGVVVKRLIMGGKNDAPARVDVVKKVLE